MGGMSGEVPGEAETAFAVFLRGVNVGGVKVTSAALQAMLATLPLQASRTLLASGNVVCCYVGDADELRVLMETALRETFGYDAKVVVLTGARLGELLDECPYRPDDPERHTYVTVTSDPHLLDELNDAVAAEDPLESMTRLGPEAAAWTAPAGGTLTTPRSKIAGRARYRQAITDRNLRTMIKVRTALEEIEA